MIFVTLGTDHHPFDRLVSWISEAIDEGFINQKVVIQNGYTMVKDSRIIQYKMIGFDQMMTFFTEAELVITHGSSTAMLICHSGVMPLVVPRIAEKGEHIDDHQLEFIQGTKDVYPFTVAFNKKQFFWGLQNIEKISNWSDNFDIGGKKAIDKFADEFNKLMLT